MQSRKELEKQQVDRLFHIVRHAYNGAPAVRNKFDTAGLKPEDIRSLKDLEKIPVTKKDELLRLQKEAPPFGGFLAVSLDTIEKVFVSPGPIFDPQTLKRTGAMAAEAFSVAGLCRGDRVMNSFSYHMVPAGHWIDKAVRLLGGTVVPTGVGNTETQVKVMHDLGITGYAGTASFLNTIIRKAEETGYDFRRDFKLRFALVGAEMLAPSLRASLETSYGIQVIDTYGTAELGIFGYNCERTKGLHISTEVILEIADPTTGKRVAPGEAGEVVVTSFDEAYALIRFGTGDLATYTDEPCECGRPTDRIMKIVGRVGEAVKVRGMFVHPRQIEQVAARFPEMSRCQLVVGTRELHDTAVLRVEISDGSKVEAACNALERVFPEICTVRLDRVERVAAGAIPAGAKVIVDERKWE